MDILTAIAIAALSVLALPLFWILFVVLICGAMVASAIRSVGRSVGLAIIRSSPGYIQMANEESEEAAKDKYWAEDGLSPGNEILSYARAKSAIRD